MTNLLIIIVSIQIILYIIMLWSIYKNNKNTIYKHNTLLDQNKALYKEYKEWREKVRDLLTKKETEWQPNQ